MNTEERQLLTRFLQDLTQSRGGMKDAEAASLIDQTVRSNPDAAYVLVQHAIIADQALHAAQARIAELEAQQQSGGAGQQGSFLGAASPWGQGSQSRPQYAPQPQYQPQAAPPSGGGGLFGGLFGGGAPQPGGFGSFLRSAGTTAAGVAGGSLLAEGLSGLFGGHRGFGGGFGGGPEVENVTINEYGDQGSYDGGSDDGGYDDGGNYDDNGNY